MKCERIELKKYFEFLGENDCNPVLDVMLPEVYGGSNTGKSKRPCMLVCPGGGYHFCSEREGEPIGLHFLPEGYNVFVLTYSVAPNKFPTQLREVAAAMELIYKNAEEWNCDTEKIAIIGFSAGGHLAAHYSTMYNCKEVREVFPESKSVNASILSYPVITADFKYAHKGSFINLIGHEPESKEEQDYFSCDCQVDENTPPAFIWHTATDDCVPVKNSFLYAEALTKHKVPVELHIYPFGHHGMSTCDEHTLDNINEVTVHNHLWLTSVKNWLKLIFKN
ncbi:MAG: alpha/beta hydrolase [Clostridia bacterium]|nr:alpha/beta hydrolase [Clostridia bacterium]